MTQIDKNLYKPFVKWAGGKRQLLPEIDRLIPFQLLNGGDMGYAEPFVGGGAVLYHLLQKCSISPKIIVNDLNSRLICAYRCVRDNVEGVIERLRVLSEQYFALEEIERKSFYLQQRAIFNAGELLDEEQTALLIFLNRTCFNGLYRENSKGSFNVPFGKYKNPQICTPEVLYATSQALQGVEMVCGDFTEILDHINGQTFFYLDPPYKPISKTSSFNAYTKVPFEDKEQVRLRDFCTELHRRGHYFVLSNSDPGNGFFDELYAGFKIERVQAKRCVNANPTKRGTLNELLISNFEE